MWAPALSLMTSNLREFFESHKWTMYERVHQICCQDNSFVRAGLDCTKWMAIDVDIKILCGLKLLVHGVSGSAFHDYFQIGEMTALLCCEVNHRIWVVSLLRDSGEIHHDKLAVERFCHMQLLPQHMHVIKQR